MSDMTIKRGDTRDWIISLTEGGSAVDLTDQDTVKVFMRSQRTSDGANKIDGEEATGSGDATGVVTYEPDAGDVDTAGDYLMEVQVTFTDGTVATFPTDGYFTVVVREDLGD